MPVPPWAFTFVYSTTAKLVSFTGSCTISLPTPPPADLTALFGLLWAALPFPTSLPPAMKLAVVTPYEVRGYETIMDAAAPGWVSSQTASALAATLPGTGATAARAFFLSANQALALCMGSGAVRTGESIYFDSMTGNTIMTDVTATMLDFAADAVALQRTCIAPSTLLLMPPAPIVSTPVPAPLPADMLATLTGAGVPAAYCTPVGLISDAGMCQVAACLGSLSPPPDLFTLLAAAHVDGPYRCAVKLAVRALALQVRDVALSLARGGLPPFGGLYIRGPKMYQLAPYYATNPWEGDGPTDNFYDFFRGPSTGPDYAMLNSLPLRMFLNDHTGNITPVLMLLGAELLLNRV